MASARPSTTILLIEDESLIRMGTVAMLEDAGHLVLEAANAEEALDVLHDHPEIRLVITDVQMPGVLDGLELVETMRRDYPEIRTLVTSGRASSRDAHDCGAHKFLSKPYSATELESVVEKLL